MVCCEDVPDKANVSDVNFVLGVKDELPNKLWKARFTVQGPEGSMKQFSVHSISDFRQYTTEFLVGVVAVFVFRLFVTALSQAYLSSTDILIKNLLHQTPK